ncbi:MAG: YkgJ family cysteine cluster protein [Sandaracinaceae bacterium]|nr:YkgJ family cysteine cluster protein [Sandaracinaceae bacterium]
MRTIHTRYEDPLDRLWTTCAERVGLTLVREPGAYASTDGRGLLKISVPDELDPDDSLAQMIFHELCHALVEGPDSFTAIDWGLDNTSDDDVLREHACIRLQAFLTRSRGLGSVLAPTTDFRLFYDVLGPDPFVRHPGEAPFSDEAGARRSITLGLQALARVGKKPWSPHFLEALDATAEIARALAPIADGKSAREGALPSIWTTIEAPWPRHPRTGLPLARTGAEAAHHTCGDCGFAARAGRTCRKTNSPTKQSDPACERWEPTPRCEDCGACCREAFDVIEVRPREAFAKKHRALCVVRADGSLDLPRPGGRCPPLVGDGSAQAPYRCTLHGDRPRTCRDFAVGGDACLTARRRVGLST